MPLIVFVDTVTSEPSMGWLSLTVTVALVEFVTVTSW